MPADALSAIFGKGAEKSAPAPEVEAPMPEETESELPPGFQEAFDEYQTAPSADAMYRMIEACKPSAGIGSLLGKK